MDPITLSMLISQLGSSVLSFTAQAKAAKKDAAYRAELAKAVWSNFANQSNQLKAQQDQKEEAISQELQQANVKTEEAQATSEASAIESGVGGVSLDSLQRGYDRTKAMNEYVAGRNIQMMGYQTTEEIKGLRANALSAINTANSQALQKPSIGTALLSGLEGVVNGYKTGSEVSSTFKKTKKPSVTSKSTGVTTL